MRSIRTFCRDEAGGEIIEYVLIAGLLLIGAIVFVAGVGVKVLARWNQVNSASL